MARVFVTVPHGIQAGGSILLRGSGDIPDSQTSPRTLPTKPKFGLRPRGRESHGKEADHGSPLPRGHHWHHGTPKAATMGLSAAPSGQFLSTDQPRVPSHTVPQFHREELTPGPGPALTQRELTLWKLRPGKAKGPNAELGWDSPECPTGSSAARSPPANSVAQCAPHVCATRGPYNQTGGVLPPQHRAPTRDPFRATQATGEGPRSRWAPAPSLTTCSKAVF